MSKSSIYLIGFMTLALIAAIESLATNEPNTTLLGLGIIALMMSMGEHKSASKKAGDERLVSQKE